MGNITPSQINTQIAKGAFRPHTALTNMALNYFQNFNNYFARGIFPIVRVRQSADNYYRWTLEDLLRDSWQRKPAYGKVMPTALGEDTDTYAVKVFQAIMGIDEIRETDVRRRQGPSIATDSRMWQTKAIAEQANIHQDIAFANSFFKSGVWANEWTGKDDTNVSGKEFIKWTNDNSDPITFVADRAIEMLEQTGRKPNRMAMGANVMNALRKHPAILDRIKYGGTSANPAQVNVNALKSLFEMDHLTVMQSIHNQAKQGKEADMKFIADPNAILLAYAPETPSIKEPSAGYIFQWDMLGDGQLMPIFQYKGENGTHSEFIEGLMAYDMKKTADDLAVFCTGVV